MSPMIRTAFACAALLMLAACGGGGSGDGAPAASGGPGTGPTPAATGPSTGLMSLAVTDAPVDEADEVVVMFTSIALKHVDEEEPIVFELDPARQIDLLALDGGGSEYLFEDEELPAGLYEWIRLGVNAGRDASDSYIIVDGARHALFIPSGNETGLKLVEGFEVIEDGEVDFTIDFVLRESVLKPPGLGGLYLLKPTLRLIDNSAVGSIEGSIAPSLLTAGCSLAVYVYQGFDVTPDDVGSGTPPFATTLPELADDDSLYLYRAANLPPGGYTVAVTCEAEDDEDGNDAIDFVDAQNATVTVGEAYELNFEPGPQTPPTTGTTNVRFEFTASRFGGGPSDSVPISNVSGNFTVSYDPANVAAATVSAFLIQSSGGTGAPGWSSSFTATSVVLNMTPTSITIGGLAPANTVVGTTNDFSLTFDFSAANPGSAPPAFETFRYSVSGSVEAFLSTSGSVTATVL